MRVRPMTDADAAKVAALCAQLGYPTTPSEIAHRLSLIDAQRDAAAFVAEDDDENVVGWIHVAGQVVLEIDPYASVGGLVVDEHVRGQGVGRLMLDAAERWAAERGYDELRLRSHIAREDAHAFYERQGYERVGTAHVFVKRI